jgi:hypothetical protein
MSLDMQARIMKIFAPFRPTGYFFVTLLLTALMSVACTLLDSGPYEEKFEEAGSWGTGRSADVEGQVQNDVYEMHVKSNHGLYLASAGENFADGIFELEATQIAGPLNNGYGLLFRVDESSDTFYVFEISGDGYVWVGYCANLCEDDAVALVGGDWFPSPAVETGHHATNNLRVVAEGPKMTFFVNGVEVGRTSDNRLTEGDIAVMVEALGEGNVRVAFDNYRFTPN